MSVKLLMLSAAVLLTGCGMREKIEDSTAAIHCNREAVQASTCRIRENTRLINESTKTLEENRRALHSIK